MTAEGSETHRGHVWRDAVLGGGLALGLITAAHASLPKPPAQDLAPAAAPAAPSQPVALIAFGEPLPGYEVGSPFGYRQMPWEEKGRLHAGVDIAGPAGQPVLAAAAGTILRIGQDGGYGRFVEIRHAEGLTTLYGHLSAFAPALVAGAVVQAGQPVGQIGSTGTSTGSHLHFEVHDARDRPLNPELFLGRSFATADDLPLRAALRAPRTVRVAYVSMIPRAKKALMEAKARAAAEADQVPQDGSEAPAAGDAAVDAADGPKIVEVRGAVSKVRGRVHRRYQM